LTSYQNYRDETTISHGDVTHIYVTHTILLHRLVW